MVVKARVEPLASGGMIRVAARVNGGTPTLVGPNVDHALDAVARQRGRLVAPGAHEPRVNGGLITVGGRVLSSLLSAAPEPLEAALRMLGAAAADVVGALDGGGQVDPLDERDAEYIGETLPALRLLSSVYFRADVRGLDNIPVAGPVLLVGNHSDGTMIADTFVFAQAFYDHFGPDRRFHQLVARSRVQVPRGESARAAVRHDPGVAGEHEAGAAPRRCASRVPRRRPRDLQAVVGVQRSGVRRPNGIHRARARAQRPDRPGRRHRRSRDCAVPWSWSAAGERAAAEPLAATEGAALGDRPPFGVAVLDLPGRIPLPFRITIRVLPRLDLRESLGRSPDPEEGYRLVTSTMQRTLTGLGKERRFPVIG